MDTEAPRPKLTHKERLKALLAEWGPLFLIVWFSIFGLTWVGFALAIQFGYGEGSSGSLSSVGTWGAAYVAAQLTKPLRLAATAVITPALGTLLRRFRRQEAKPAPEQTPGELPPSGTLDETPSGQP